jgi:curved DNA-binding protein CbpA
MSQAAGPDAGGHGEVELPAELQREIRSLAERLPAMNCYELLGLPRGATAEQLRTAFFECSRRFHPDRYFKKRLGPFGPLLNEIYKRMVAAHGVLRDPDLRGPYDRSLGPLPPAQPAGETAAGPGTAPSAAGTRGAAHAQPSPTAAQVTRSATQPSASVATPGRTAKLAPPAARPPEPPRRARPSTGSSLRARPGRRAPLAGLDGLAAQLAASRRKARQSFDQASELAARGQWLDAARSCRIALAFDPRAREYHDGLAEWLPRADREAARDAVVRGDRALAAGQKPVALRAYAGACELAPTDAALALRTASLALELRDHALAAQLAECAVCLDDDAKHKRLLAQVYTQQGRKADARRILEALLEADPRDAQARAALAHL